MTVDYRERLAEIWRELKLDVGHSAERPSKVLADTRTRVTPPSCQAPKPSTWSAACTIARLRDHRRSMGVDASVRSLAREVGCSRGRAGELLQFHDAFASELVLLGLGNAKEGEEMLSRLSYRQLREILTIDSRMSMTRIFTVRRLAKNQPGEAA